jgi:hypothetical protein
MEASLHHYNFGECCSEDILCEVKQANTKAAEALCNSIEALN